jgi:hypothetical protein
MAKEKDIFATLEPTEDRIALEPKDGKKKPRPSEPEWTDYILGQLEKDEKYEEYPKLDGLKRLLQKEIGEIELSESRLVASPSFDNMHTYIVQHTIKVNSGGVVLKYSALAEANQMNLSPPYDKYPASIASTRAYGRAVRDALKLKNVVAAEEIDDSESSDTANKAQVNAIYALAKKNNLDIVKVINYDQFGKVMFESPEKLDKATATDILKFINKCQQNPDLAKDYK